MGARENEVENGLSYVLGSSWPARSHRGRSLSSGEILDRPESLGLSSDIVGVI